VSADDLKDWPHLLKAFDEGVATGLHRGLQIYISQHGQPLLEAALGEAEPGLPLTSEHRMLWLSSGKPLLVLIFARIWERGLIGIDQPICHWIEEFSTHGKETITFRHVLTHTGGFRVLDLGWETKSWPDVIELICRTSLENDWVVGVTAGYHTISSWFILAEALSRATGLSVRDLFDQELRYPLGLPELSIGLSEEWYIENQSFVAPMYARIKGELQLLDWHQPPRAICISPGSNTRGRARDLGAVYEMILKEGEAADGSRYLHPTTIAALTARHRVGQFDLTLQHVVDFGLGFIINSQAYGPETVPYSYGLWTSPRTFGHGGSQSSIGFCDPESGIVVTWATNGMPGEGWHQRRNRALQHAIGLDLFERFPQLNTGAST
jgi:CubicO group peptidase (beta-lactamase class C family)